MRYGQTVALACCLAGLLTAAPPVPSTLELTAPVGKPTVLTVKGEAGKKLGTAKTYDPAGLMLARLWSDDPTVYEFWVFPNADGVYFVPFWTEGETTSVVVKVVAGKAPPVVVVPPKDPPAPIGGKLHVKIVRPSGPSNDAHERIMASPVWSEVGQLGKDYSESVISEMPPAAQAAVTARLGGSALPVVTFWTYTNDGKILLADKPFKKMPANDTEIREVLK